MLLKTVVIGFGFMGVLGVGWAVRSSGSAREPEVHEQVRTDRKAPGCGTFEGGTLSARWTDCPDQKKREVACATFIDDLKCECYEDGVSKHWFFAKDPPLATRADATRVANASCRWSLEP